MYGEGDVHVGLRATIVSHAILLPRNSWRKYRSMPFWCQMWTLVRNVPPLNYDLDRSSFWPMRTSKGDNLLRPQAQFDTIVNLINCICLPFYICWLGLKWFSGISNFVSMSPMRSHSPFGMKLLISPPSSSFNRRSTWKQKVSTLLFWHHFPFFLAAVRPL